MINRPGRSPRSRSVTSPARASLLTCGFTLATVTVATLNTPVASAEPVVRCRTREGGGDYTCITETPTPTTGTTGSGSSESGGLGAWFSEHAGVILFVIAVAAVIAIVAAVKSGTSKDKAAASEAELARGRQISLAAHAAAVQRAHAEAAAQMPPREVWDPMNMGAVPPTPEPVIPAPPSTDPTDLQRYNAFGAVTPWEAGTAFAAVVDRDGSLARATAAWLTAAQAAGLGEVDEDGTFTPSATLTNVRYVNDGDVQLVVQPAGLHIAEKALDKVLPFLVVKARVESASPFVREAATGRYCSTLTNRTQEVQAPAPETTPANDPSNWEW
ncbi:hypothetical protein [Mycobacteroides abscessus]|uniref:hypothetical protein n=1 Tax=Mycobacteroides abscessus TaxID=36809 RepID=UPI001F1F5EFD|nr:hypothetical protein [Mycobacteroides abscessus]